MHLRLRLIKVRKAIMGNCTESIIFPSGSAIKNLPRIQEMQEIWVQSPGLGTSPGGGRDNILQYSCLENPIGRGTWWSTVHSAALSRTELKRLSIHACMQRVQFGSLCTANMSQETAWAPIASPLSHLWVKCLSAKRGRNTH